MPVTSREAVPLRVVETVLEQQNRPPAKRLLGVRDAPVAPSLGELNKDTLGALGSALRARYPARTQEAQAREGLVIASPPSWRKIHLSGPLSSSRGWINSSCFSRSCA